MLAAGQITRAVADRITGLPLAAESVFTDRAWPLAEKDLPAWRVVEVDEDVAPMTIHPGSPNLHALQIELRGACRAVGGLDDEMRALAAEALTALFNPPGAPDALSTLGNRVVLTLRRIERAMVAEGEASVGQTVITLRAEFKTLPSAPETII